MNTQSSPWDCVRAKVRNENQPGDLCRPRHVTRAPFFEQTFAKLGSAEFFETRGRAEICSAEPFATAPPVGKTSAEPFVTVPPVGKTSAEPICARGDCPIGTRAPMRDLAHCHVGGDAELGARIGRKCSDSNSRTHFVTTEGSISSEFALNNTSGHGSAPRGKCND